MKCRRPTPRAAVVAVGLAALLAASLGALPAATRAAGRPAGRGEARTGRLQSRAAPRAAVPGDPLLDAFARDLAAASNAPTGRARAVAAVALAEARGHGLPPALLYGVLLTENAGLRSQARSRAGAVGLMQVMPLWVPLLAPVHGRDVRVDSTNVAFGAHILAGHARGGRGWRHVLLRYNGCRPGRRHCAGYPERVRRHVEAAGALCPSGSFEVCVARPLAAAHHHTRPGVL